MKKCIVALSLLMLVTGPNQPTTLLGQKKSVQSNRGTVVLNFGKSALPGEVRTITAVLTRPGYQPIRKSVSAKAVPEPSILRIEGVPAGDWIVSVRGENQSRVSICSGTSSLSVEPNLTSVGEISLAPATFSFSWGRERIRWKMHPGNPVLQQSDEGWDSNHYYFDDPVVLKINNVYHMWYSSATNDRTSDEESFWIAYATSPDGINWAKHGAVISPGPQGSWMDMGALSPSVIYEDGVFRMWFVGAQHFQRYRNGIGYAISKDGKTWEVEQQPVIPPSQSIPIAWNTCVVKKDGLWYQYVGVSNITTTYPTDVVLLTSVDGKIWSERGKVLSARKEIPWQKSGIIPGQVIYDEHRFKMFYTGLSDNSFSIGYAESTEGLNWSNTSDLPTLGLSDTPPWVTNGVGWPAVIRDQGKLKIWFSGLTDRSHGYHIGYAEQAE